MTIYFSNPGSLDIRLLSTFGVNAKPGTSSPIGRFGTGMKYAIAGVLRLGGTITIESQGECWTVSAKEANFRGTSVRMAYLEREDDGPQPLPFSTDLGSHWEPWMIYREFRCNATDEGGPAKPSTSYPLGAGVIFAINCPAVEAVLAQHSTYFTESTPYETFGTLEIHPGTSNYVYFKGVAVFKAPKPLLFRYNFTSGISLTEDRTAGAWEILWGLAHNLARGSGPVVESILTAPEANFEHNISWEYILPCEEFRALAARIAQATPTSLPKNAALWIKTNLPESLAITTIPFSPEQLKLLASAKAQLASAFSYFPDECWLTTETKAGHMGFVYGEKIYLNPEAFSSLPQLFSTLLEEHIHLAFGHADFSREFQEHMHSLLRKLIFGGFE